MKKYKLFVGQKVWWRVDPGHDECYTITGFPWSDEIAVEATDEDTVFISNGVGESEVTPDELRFLKFGSSGQYWNLKNKHGDVMLMFRRERSYEFYYQDAVDAAQILGITLAHKGSGKTEMAGFPHAQLDKYLPMLLRTGKRVAICDQQNEAHNTTTTDKTTKI